MAAIRSKDTKPELIVRRAVHRRGFRFRLHRHDLPGKPDLVFPRLKLVLFVHGCFWHSHDDPNCKIARLPKSNQDFWIPKLQRTKERDRANSVRLEEAGWDVATIWECEVRRAARLPERIDAIFSKYD